MHQARERRGSHRAGRYLGRLREPARQVRERVDRSDRWREPVMLLGEHLCFRNFDPERLDAILSRLVPAPPPDHPMTEDWRAAWPAGDLFMLYRRALQGRLEADRRVIERLGDLLQTGALTPRECAAAARTLAVLGDPRPGVGVDPATGELDVDDPIGPTMTRPASALPPPWVSSRPATLPTAAWT